MADTETEAPAATDEQARSLMDQFTAIGMPHLVDAPQVNRFMVANAPQGGPPVFVFGSAYLLGMAPDGLTIPLVKVVAAIAIPKTVAEDLAVRLRQAYDITDEEMAAAEARNPHPA